MWPCVGKGYNKTAAVVALHFVNFTKKVLGLWPTSNRNRIMLRLFNASIMVLIILVKFCLTPIVIIFKSEIVLKTFA